MRKILLLVVIAIAAIASGCGWGTANDGYYYDYGGYSDYGYYDGY